ncbi:hypothetical protein QCE49_14170 [Caballeronia sp. LZ008]|uniref:hypothetical protein n=1 Tax=Caballeronia sp. INML5 TaxID=2921750 RepID=UPI00202878B1|nr:hypothetical protein [Caballeronia sp. INML5]MDR5794523.1 hypothetical protein [Caballeronia sp. LZ008]
MAKNGEPFVALIDTRKLDYWHALEAEHRQPRMLGDIAKGLEDVLSCPCFWEIQFRESVEVLTLKTVLSESPRHKAVSMGTGRKRLYCLAVQHLRLARIDAKSDDTRMNVSARPRRRAHRHQMLE